MKTKAVRLYGENDLRLEEFDLPEDVMNVAVRDYYDMIYDHLTEGKTMRIVPEQVLKQIKVIDLIHAQNPLPVKGEQ